MGEQKWEYCIFDHNQFNVGMQEVTPDRVPVVATFVLRFCGPEGRVIVRLVHNVTPQNAEESAKEFLLGKIIGHLGCGGWEMVATSERRDLVDFCTTNSIFFKRPVIEGRTVEQPAFDLLL